MEQQIIAGQYLYRNSILESEEWQFARQLLLRVAQQVDLPVEQTTEVARSLCHFSAAGSEEWQFAIRLLLQVAQEQYLNFDQRMQAIVEIFSMTVVLYAEKLQAMQLALELLSPETTEQFFEAHWRPVAQEIEPELSDIPSLAKFAWEEKLPTRIRDALYQALYRMVPRFAELKS